MKAHRARLSLSHADEHQPTYAAEPSHPLMLDLVTHLDRVNNATSVEALWRLHLDAMAAFGFDRLLYEYTRYRSGRSLGDPQDWVVLANLPSAYMRPYIEDGLCDDGEMTAQWSAPLSLDNVRRRF